jgi:glycosyltransferase involved in cell wall biosynthesis
VRILMLAQFYPPTIGGEEQHVRTLSAALAARGHRVAVATLWHEGLAEFECDGAVRVYRIKGSAQRLGWLFSERGRRHAPPLPDPELTLALGRIVRRERPQIVHAHNWLVHSFVPIKRLSGARLVMTLHDFSLVCAQKNLLYRDSVVCSGPGLRKCLRCVADHYGTAKGAVTLAANTAAAGFERSAVDRFIAVSRATAIGNGLSEGNVPWEVIPNFLPEAEGDGSASRYGAFTRQLPDGPYLLFVGDLRRFKGIETLFRAYEQLAGAPPLVLIGRRCADTPPHLPHNVVALGAWPHGAVLQAWRGALFGLVTSIGLETFGIVALEAMAAGKPVIASNIGGLPDVVADGETGLLVPPGDAAALAVAMRRLLADAPLREQMGAAARRRAASFRAESVVARIEQTYRRLLAGGVGTPAAPRSA